jgi:hypothetical protein
VTGDRTGQNIIHTEQKEQKLFFNKSEKDKSGKKRIRLLPNKDDHTDSD